MSASTTPAATPAATPASAGNAVNVAIGYPAQERWPGPVDPGTYTDAGPDYPLEAPPYGSWTAEPFLGAVPEGAPGGGVQDTSWQTGTDGPMVPWDSSAGAPFAPSGPVPPLLHAEDTGAVFVGQHVTPAEIGRQERHTGQGQTYNREYAFDPVTGENVPAANGRTNMDQIQTRDPAPADGGGYNPWDPGYSERPVFLNVAYQATAVSDSGPQGVSGDLPDRAPYQNYAAEAYEAPPDPAVLQGGAPAPDTAGGWLLG